MKRRWPEGKGGGGYSRDSIFIYFLQTGAIIRGRRLIKGRLLFEEIL